MSLLRILKIAETLYENDKNEYYRVLPLLDGHIKKRAHFSPMAGPGDYDFSGEAENLPWSGNMSEFMRKFPGGLPQWKAMREKLKSKSFVIKDDVMVAKNELLPLNSPAIKRPKVAHYEPKNDKTTPNPWRRNMDYAEWENSPYYGSMSEFMKKFPGGIEDWRKWREKTKGDRYTKWDDGPTKKKNRKARRDMVLGLMKVADEELMSPPDDPVYISLQEESGMDPRAFDERVLSEIDNDLKTKENWIRNAVVVYGISTGRSNAFSFLNDPEISRDNYRENAMDTVFEELRSLNLLRFREIGVEAALGGFEEVEESDEFKKERQALKEDSEESAADDRDDRWLAEKIADDYIADLYWDEEYDREALIKALMRGMRDRREEGSTTPEKEYPMNVEPKPGRWEERPKEMSGIIEAHYEPETVEFVKLTGPKEWMKSVKEFLKKRKDEGQSAEDAAYDAAKEFVDYWKLLLKAKNKRAAFKKAAIEFKDRSEDIKFEDVSQDFKRGDVVMPNPEGHEMFHMDYPLEKQRGIVMERTSRGGKAIYKVLVVLDKDLIDKYKSSNPRDLYYGGSTLRNDFIKRVRPEKMVLAPDADKVWKLRKKHTIKQEELNADDQGFEIGDIVKVKEGYEFSPHTEYGKVIKIIPSKNPKRRRHIKVLPLYLEAQADWVYENKDELGNLGLKRTTRDYVFEKADSSEKLLSFEDIIKDKERFLPHMRNPFLD